MTLKQQHRNVDPNHETHQTLTSSNLVERGLLMSARDPNFLPFSAEGLRSLQENLLLHGELAYIWRNPVTDQLDIKRVPVSASVSSNEAGAYMG